MAIIKSTHTLPYSIRHFAETSRSDGIARAIGAATQRVVDRPLYLLRDCIDSAHDKRICGISLEKSVSSPYGDSHGAIDSIHSPYGSLDEIFGPENFTANDVFLDVGCGKGRPLAYLLEKHFPGKLEGVELTPEVADYAKSWACNYDNVEVISGNVFDLDLSKYTAFFMFIPMASQYSRALVSKIEREAVHHVRLFYLCDKQDGDYIDARPNWALQRRGWIYRKHGIPMHGKPQRYSVWDYTPDSNS